MESVNSVLSPDRSKISALGLTLFFPIFTGQHWGGDPFIFRMQFKLVGLFQITRHIFCVSLNRVCLIFVNVWINVALKIVLLRPAFNAMCHILQNYPSNVLIIKKGSFDSE